MRKKRCCIISSHFSTIFSHFFAIYLSIFHKTEVLTVILRSWTGLNLNWFKSYDTKHKWSDKHAVLIVGIRFRLCFSFSVKNTQNRKTKIWEEWNNNIEISFSNFSCRFLTPNLLYIALMGLSSKNKLKKPSVSKIALIFHCSLF